MSYDLDLFTPRSDLDPIATIQAAALHSESAETPLNQDIAKKLKYDNPDFHLRSAKPYPRAVCRESPRVARKRPPGACGRPARPVRLPQIHAGSASLHLLVAVIISLDNIALRRGECHVVDARLHTLVGAISGAPYQLFLEFNCEENRIARIFELASLTC